MRLLNLFEAIDLDKTLSDYSEKLKNRFSENPKAIYYINKPSKEVKKLSGLL